MRYYCEAQINDVKLIYFLGLFTKGFTNHLVYVKIPVQHQRR